MQIVSTEDEMQKSVIREKWKKNNKKTKKKKKKKKKKTKKKKHIKKKTKKKKKKLQNVICWKFYTEYLALKHLIVKTSWLLCEYISLHKI